MAKNLFEKAKKESKPKTAKKDDKIIVDVKGEEFAKKLEAFATLKNKMDEMKDILYEMVENKEIKIFLNPENNSGEQAFHIEILNKDDSQGKPKDVNKNIFEIPSIQKDNTEFIPPHTTIFIPKKNEKL